MFTGLIEGLGSIAHASQGPGLRRLEIRTPWPASQLVIGESVAVDGVCLTVATVKPDGFLADVVLETLSRTTLGDVEVGARVNLERSLRLSDRLGGHLVQGHVDGTVTVLDLCRAGGDVRMRCRAPMDLRRFLAEKGSVALSGVSLTLAAVGGDDFEVALVPETLSRTTLGGRRQGDRLNLEVDLVARYLDRLTGLHRAGQGGP